MDTLSDGKAKVGMATQSHSSITLYSHFSVSEKITSPEVDSQNNFMHDTVSTWIDINSRKVSCLIQQRVEVDVLFGSQSLSESIWFNIDSPTNQQLV